MVKRILTLNSEAEAQRIRNILDINEIPFMIRTFHDSVYDGIFQNQYGWGVLEADEINEEKIISLINEDFTDNT